MFGLDMNMLAFIGLVTLAIGGVAFTFLFDRVSNEAKQDKRIKGIRGVDDKKSDARRQAKAMDVAKRRQATQKSLQELEEKNKKENAKKKVTLKQQFAQAGWKISLQQFVMMSVAMAVVLTLGAFVMGAPILIVGACLVIGGLGLPRWILARAIKKRMKKFLEEFPNAVDVIVRGIKAGLPLNDCLGIVGNEAKEPVASEFKKIIETQQMGIPMTEAIMKLYQNIPLTEANFFGIVIAIQQQAGGNLSEALGNLSGVLRDRKKMKAKIQAMSAEAKASGGIIGALPIAVALLVYITTPDYIMVLFEHPTGHLILLGSAVWMAIGIMVMKNMINFDF